MTKRSPVIREVDSNREVRLLVNEVCNYSCSFPGTGCKWCHEDGIGLNKSGSERKNASVEDFLFFVEALKKSQKIEKVKIGAMEPLLYEGLTDLIKGLKNLGCREVSLTTNGFFLSNRLEDLKESGLDTLTVSMHAFNRDDYKEITKVDAFDRVKVAVEEATKMGFKRVKINRVLLNINGLNDDLMRFFDWSVKNGISSVKLYKLIWSNEMSEESFFENYFPWEALRVFFKNEAKLKEVKRYKMAGRDRLTWELKKNGLLVETDVFKHKFGKEIPKICRNCEMAAFCQEGLMSYGIEIGPELRVSACLLKEDISLDLWKNVKDRDGETMREALNLFIGKIRKK